MIFLYFYNSIFFSLSLSLSLSLLFLFLVFLGVCACEKIPLDWILNFVNSRTYFGSIKYFVIVTLSCKVYFRRIGKVSFHKKLENLDKPNVTSGLQIDRLYSFKWKTLSQPWFPMHPASLKLQKGKSSLLEKSSSPNLPIFGHDQFSK